MAPIDDDLPVTELLHRYGAGDRDAGERLADIVYRSLHDRAQQLIRREGSAHTLHPTGLVHEAWIRLSAGAASPYQDRRHFLRLAGRVMRNVLVDHARKKQAACRSPGPGEEQLGSLDSFSIALSEQQLDPIDVLALHDALARLQELDPDLAEIVELRFFAGLTFEEAGEALGTSAATAHRTWRLAQAWLLREFGAGD